MDRPSALFSAVPIRRPPVRLPPVVVALVFGVAAISCLENQQRDDSPVDVVLQPWEQSEATKRDRQSREMGERERLWARKIDLDEVVAWPPTYEEEQVRGEASVQQVVSERLFYIGPAETKRLAVVFGHEVETPTELSRGQRVRVSGRVLKKEKAIKGQRPNLDERAEARLRGEVYVLLIWDGADVTVIEK